MVERWDEFQHLDVMRSSRGAPPWIKNFTRLLDSDEYLELSGSTRGVLHGIWLLTAKQRAEVRGTTSSLSRRLNMRVTNEHIDTLVQAGFITLSARKPHAESTQDASSLAGARGELEGEESTTPSSALSSTSRSEETARESAAPKAPPHAFVCSFAYEHGPCGIEFKTEEALQAHQANVHTQLNGTTPARAQSPREALLLDKREIPF